MATPKQSPEQIRKAIADLQGLLDKPVEPAKPLNDPAAITIKNGASSWFIAAVGIVMTAALIGYDQWQKSELFPVVPPAPVVVPQVIDDTRCYVTKDGITVGDEQSKIIVAAAKLGDGKYALLSFPVGKPPITKQLQIGDVKPIDPVKPDPVKPDPVKPDPVKPQVDPPPITDAGFRVLIVYENNPADPLSIISKEQQGALGSLKVREYLDRKCVKGKDGKTPEWRIFDKDQSMTGETKVWQDAMKLPRNVIPWIVISDGKAGTSQPLPATETELLALLKKYGGGD